ncbi:MAG: adenosylmethionine--8-amino-7-oxononanoate transaminase [Hirschia sp.]|nr:adenosylmethionine--8-amino-7-oxononanoate transaminase [Hirschia sp.]MBF18521.1 adenosylmethionine--8-amino-7-oxononanoate transaminase [Hirschia sp.]
MHNPDWLETGLNHIWLPYTQMKTAPTPVGVSHIEGVTLELTDGRKLVDGVGSWWTCVHGYNHPRLKAALIEQLDRLPHVMLGGLGHEPAYALATRLATLTPGDLNRSFFCESGSVAVEVAMKVAVQYWLNTGEGVRPKFLAFKGGYHGDTFATMSVCDPDEGMHSLFGEALPAQHIVDLPTDEASIAALNDTLAQNKDIAAVIVEPLIQGAGGMRMHDAATLRQIREACDRHNVILIFDEIFTGLGRTGDLFASIKSGVTPDIMTIGKALTGGITPLAAAVVSERIYAAFHDEDGSKALMHGPTFTGHALACAVAMASLDLIEETDAIGKVRKLEAELTSRLAPLRGRPNVAEVRVMGAVAAVELNHDFNVDDARAAFIARGTFIRPLGRVIYLTPSYTIQPEELSVLTEAISAIVDALGDQAASAG